MKNNGLIRVPATSANLGPGFDCLGLALDLYNEIEYEILEEEGAFELSIQGEGKESLSQVKDNLLYQSFERACKAMDKRPPGVKVKQINRIPLSRGLGSSSAAIVGGLVMANEIAGNPLSNDDLLKLAVEIEGHPDNVAPALLGGFVISFKEKNDIIAKKIDVPQSLAATVIVPEFQLSTKESRQAIPANIPLEDAVFNIGRASLLVASLMGQDYKMMSYALADKLHQNYRAALVPGLLEIIERARQMDIIGTALSGAGPSMIIFHEKKAEFDIDILGKILEKENVFFEIYKLNPVGEGASKWHW